MYRQPTSYLLGVRMPNRETSPIRRRAQHDDGDQPSSFSLGGPPLHEGDVLAEHGALGVVLALEIDVHVAVVHGRRFGYSAAVAGLFDPSVQTLPQFLQHGA